MNAALWIVQGLLAVVYLMAGGIKLALPIDQVGKRMPPLRDVAPAFIRFIGTAEVLGVIGLILPMTTGILPWLTVAAAAGLVLVQVGAMVFQVSRRTQARLPLNVVLLLLALFVVVGRLAIGPVL